MAITSTGSFGQLLEPGLKAIYEAHLKQIPRMAESILQSFNTGKQSEHFLDIAGFGAAPQISEGASVYYDDPIQGNKKSLTQLRYGLGFQVTEEMVDFDQYGRIKAYPGKLARSMQYAVETAAAGVFNNGFTATTGTLTADGQSLFATAHVLLGGGTYANRPSTEIDLSVSGLEAAIQNMQLITDDRGMITPHTGRILLVHPADQWTAKKILGSEKDPDSANNTINPLKGGLDIMVWPYLSDSDAWFVLGTKEDRDQGPMIIWSKRPDFVRDTNSDTRVAKFNSVERFVVGAVQWRGCYGSSGG